MTELDDHFYIKKVLDGDHAAYAVLVDSYKRLVYSIALKVLKDTAEAQDVAQEGFIKAYQQLQQFEGKSKFSTWLYTIVFRTAIARKKELEGQKFFVLDAEKENLKHDNFIPQLAQLNSDDNQKFIRQAIDNLPEVEGLIVVLYYIHEHSISEIHQITGISMPNIKIKLFRARKRLERELRFLL